MKKFLSFFACLMFVLSINTSAQTTYHLKKGSNWFSTTVATNLESLKEALGTSGVSIVSQKDGFLTYEAGVWTGSLASFDNAQMYVINVAQDVDIVLDGDRTYPTITLYKGWNWIYGIEMSIEDAFKSITPMSGDLIKSSSAFSVYVNNIGWVGDLKSLKDGEGYKYYSNSESEQHVKYYSYSYSYFSVSSTKKVYFSSGNIQYQASSDTWRFAEKQWDYIGEANKNISSTYSGWIDLFGWGSGNNPTKSSTSPTFYYGPYYDWGDYCGLPTPEGTTGNWRTLTKDEWDYVMFKRTTSSGVLYAKAKVNNVSGTIVVPDEWNKSIYSLNNTNDDKADFSVNVISASTWESVLEPAGCVFLPAAGYRGGINIYSVDSYGQYWSSTPHATEFAECLYFFSDCYMTYNYRCHGRSVRLVADVK